MDKVEKILWLIMVISLALCGVAAAYGEERADVYETLRLTHSGTPVVCVFEVNPELTDDWADIERVTYEAIYEWKDQLENISHQFFIPIYGTIPWEEHAIKHARDYPVCNILINFEEYSEGDALGTTHIDFSHSTHKYMFINVYLNQDKPTINVTLDGGAGTIEYTKKLYPMPLNTIRNIVLHEFGHGLGLGHYNTVDGVNGGENIWDSSVMVPTLEAFNEDLVMTVRPNDIEMIKEMYGEDGFIRYLPTVIPESCKFLNNTKIQCNS